MQRSLPALGCLPLGCLALALSCPAQQLEWTKINTTTSPPARDFAAAAYDASRQRTVLFSGRGSGVGADTWEYDGKNWTKMNPTTSPPARNSHAMTYDTVRKRVVLFGGAAPATVADTWEYDGKTWTQIKTATSPPARRNHGLVFDEVRKLVLCFGGATTSFSGGPLADTWQYDGKNWTQIKTASAPPPRASFAMAYDFSRVRAVLFGAWVSNTQVLGDTWEMTPARSWIQIKPTTQPASRGFQVMAYDASRRRTVMYGGWTGSVPLADTWEFDGKDWTQLKPKTSPGGHASAVMVYDSVRKRMVLFSGFGGRGVLADTWELGAPQTLTASPPTVSIASGGKQTFSLDAGTAHARRLYWILGSVTGTSPGVTLASGAGSVNIPLNPDFWTDITIGLANSALLTSTRATLDAAGKAQASLNVPKITNQSAIGVTFYHAYLVYDAQSNFYMASNPVELKLVK